MTELFFENALLPSGWARNVLITCDAAGMIETIMTDSPTPAKGTDGSIAVAGMANLHSHAFQRAMAGLGEWRGEGDDSFWSWREVMYRFLQKLRPEDLRAIAAQLYVEMLEAGFTAVGEFHYIHHQADGVAYDNPAEMAQQIMAACDDTGMALTLLPVMYQYGGFGETPAQPAQARFCNSTDQFLQLVENCSSLSTHARTVVGIAPHSLRAVSPDSLKTIVDAHPESPIHIHIAEQVKEVEDCIAWSGARPVQWLLDNLPVDNRWCLVHATHLDEAETTALAATHAIAGICPITEANLGDGIFNGVAYQQAGGRWGIGSDSHIRIDLAEELRSLEYSQRLRDLGRNRLAKASQANGRALFDAALHGGAQALDQPMGEIAEGKWCDIVSLKSDHPALLGKHDDDWLNSWVFAGDKSCIQDVWLGGKHVVQNSAHIERADIAKRFAKTMDYLMDH